MIARDESDDREPTDEALAASVRSGDDAAFAELWRRHVSAGTTAARRFADIADADDLTAEAYLRIFKAVRQGGGPFGAFRPYLYRTIRNIALDWRTSAVTVPLETPEVEAALADPDPETVAAERTVTVRAFQSLPERWRMVLWYLEVEGMEPAEAAPILGLSANATSALAVRAREGLRKAWLQAHVNEIGVADGCGWTTQRMGEYARGGLSRRSRERFRSHLRTCESCTALLADLGDVGGRLAVVLLPLGIGVASGTALLASGSKVAPEARSSGRGGVTRVAVAAGVGAIMLTAVAAGAWALTTAFSPPSAAPPASTEPASTPTPENPVSPSPTPESTAPGVDAPEGSAAVRPPSLPRTPLDRVAPELPTLASPIDAAPVSDARPRFSGSGEPGAIVTIAWLDSATGTLRTVATAVVGPDGTWSAIPADPLPDGRHEMRVSQSDAAGNRSGESVRVLIIDTVALAPVVDALPSTPLLFLPVTSGDGEPGATLTLSDESGSLLGTTTVDDFGRWSLLVPDPVRDGAQLTARQQDLAGNVSVASPPSQPLVFDRPTMPGLVEGAALPSDGGATVVQIQLAGIEGMSVEVLIDGVGTGNTHVRGADPLVRVTPPLGDGPHTLGVRYVDRASGRVGSTATTGFSIGG